MSSETHDAVTHVARLSTGGPLPRDLRVTLNFHPGRGVLKALAADRRYRSQFETGTSNGGLTAHPGGDRWRWESRIFGGAYDHADPQDRPKYGALNHRRREQGAAPRFGSAHLRLTEEVLARTTFCYPDSVYDPHHFGTRDRCALIEIANADDKDELDDYVEAHVHGPIHVEHIEALVLDPCYRNTEIHEQAENLGCAVEWHAGFRLSTQDLDRNATYRTEAAVRLGHEIADEGFIIPRHLDDCAAEPQVVKHLWHHVARFGWTKVQQQARKSPWRAETRR